VEPTLKVCLAYGQQIFRGIVIPIMSHMTIGTGPLPDGEVFHLTVFVSADMAKLTGGVEHICLVEKIHPLIGNSLVGDGQLPFVLVVVVGSLHLAGQGPLMFFDLLFALSQVFGVIDIRFIGKRGVGRKPQVQPDLALCFLFQLDVLFRQKGDKELPTGGSSYGCRFKCCLIENVLMIGDAKI